MRIRNSLYEALPRASSAAAERDANLPVDAEYAPAATAAALDEAEEPAASLVAVAAPMDQVSASLIDGMA